MNIEKPKNVKTALSLLWITLAFGVVRIFLDFSSVSEKLAAVGGSKFFFIITSVVFVFMAFLFYLIGKRKNWARWVYTVLFVLGAPSTISSFSETLQENLFSGILGIIVTLVQMIALGLLFSAPARAWFKSTPSPVTPESGI